MPAPTLLTPGSLRAPADADQKQPPITYIIEWLKKRMPEFGGRGAQMGDRVLVIQSETGSGKSTVLPAEVFRILRAPSTSAKAKYSGASVLCTQPRVLTAITLARQERASPHYADLANVVGFQTGALTDKPIAGLVFATIGVLAAQLKTLEDELIMEKYRFIIVDEAHERSKEADMTLMRLKNFYQRNLGNRRLPFLILASATFDTVRYAAFFGVSAETNVVRVAGRAYPIAEHFPAAGTNDYVEAAAAKALELHEKNPEDNPAQADILIFMPGNEEMSGVATILRGAARRAARPFLVLLVNREAILDDTPDYRAVFTPPADLPPVRGTPPTRRIIVATVVAETGLTVETLKYVIDCGWSRTVESYPPWGATGLTTRPAPISRIKQRMGRVGRLFPGEFHPLYTKNVYGALDPQQLPDIVTGGVKDIFLDIVDEQLKAKRRAALRAKAKGGASVTKGGAKRESKEVARPPDFRVEDLDMLDVPPSDALAVALEAAEVLGFVAPDVILDPENPDSERGYGLTALGQIASKFTRIPLEGARIILAGEVHGANLRDLATIVASFGRPLASFFAELATPNDVARLLADVAPPVIRVTTGGGETSGDDSAPKWSSAGPGLAYYRARLLVADTFLETLFLLDAFAERLSRSAPLALAWCADFGLDPESIIALIAARDEILNDMVGADLDPFRPRPRSLTELGRVATREAAAEFREAVIALKRCLYDGLRLNVLTYDEKRDAYISRHGLPVAVGVLADKEARELGCEVACRPRRVATDAITLSLTRGKEIIYTLKAKMFAVLDGFVETDTGFAEFQRCPIEQTAGESKKAKSEAKKETVNAVDPQARLRAYRRACAADDPTEPMTRRLPDRIREVLLAGRFASLEPFTGATTSAK